MKSRWLNITLHWFWMLPVLLIVFGLAVRQVGRFPISVDELLSINNAGYISDNNSPSAIFQNLETYSAQHVPAYFILLGFASELFGWTPFALRMIGVSFGVLGLAWVYRLGHDQQSGSAGLYAVLFIAGLTLYSFYYAHIRMYTMFITSVAFFLWIYLRILQAKRDIYLYEWGMLSISTLLFLSTHIFSILLLIPVGIYHLLFVPNFLTSKFFANATSKNFTKFKNKENADKENNLFTLLKDFFGSFLYRKKNKQIIDSSEFIRSNLHWLRMSLAMVLAGLPLVFWLPVLLKGFQHTSTFSIVTSNALTPPEIVVNLLVVYSNSIIPLLIIWLSAAIFMSRQQEKKLRFWLGLTLTTTLFIIILGALTPIITPDRMRYTFVLLVPLALAFGMTLTQFRYHVIIAGVCLVIWIGSDLYMRRQFDMSQYLGGRMNIYDMPRLDKDVPLIASATDENMLILSFSNHRDLTLEVRHGNSIQDFYFDSINRHHYSLFLPQADLRTDAEIQSDLSTALEGWAYVALLEDSEQRPSKQIHQLYVDVLSEKYNQCEVITLSNHLKLTVFVASGENCIRP